MAIASTGRKSVNNAAGVASLNNTHNSSVAGNLIVCATSAWGNPTAPTSVAVSDGANGTYTVGAFVAAVQAAAALNYKENGAGGNLTVTSNPSGAPADSNDMSVYTEEFSGVALSSSLSVAAVTNTGSSATSSTGNITPADNDCLIVAWGDYDGSGVITGNAGGEGFTQSNIVQGGTAQPGWLFWKILTGGAGVPISFSTSFSMSAAWSCGIAAFKPQASTFISQLALLGAG